jgi:hypothetical protein
MSHKLKLLLLAANSVDTVDSRASDEIQAIDRAIQAAPFRDSFDLRKEPAIRVSDIGPSLLKHRPDILHISAHSRETEGLILENDLGRVAKVQCTQLKDVLVSAGLKLQLVFYSFCHSADCAKETSTQIDFVVGMEGEIAVKSSLAFSPAFYAALASGHSIQEAVEYAKSILDYQKYRGARAIVLQVRDGADAKKSLLKSAAVANASDSISERVARVAGNEKVLSTVSAGITPPLPPPVFLGREDALQDIKRLLSVNRGANQENITVVRGWPGVGKTSMVSAIGHDPEIVRTFTDGVLWTSLEQKPNVITEMARWGRALGSEEILKAATVKDARALLAALLSKRRMLLIVDDVWEKDHAAAFAEAAGEQCAVMVTTRLTKVADALTIDQSHTYNLPVLTEEFALKVLRILIPDVVSQNEGECFELVRDLECLPLALHVAAGLLRSEARLGWGVTELIEKIRTGTELLRAQAPTDRMEKDGFIPSVAVLLQRSTEILDEETRERFIFLGGFAPKPATFDLPAMQAVWQVDDPKPTIRELVGHGLLEPAGHGRFQMHRILVDHARSLCTED